MVCERVLWANGAGYPTPTFAQVLTNTGPAGRWGIPADLGGTAVFLASSASDYVNGAVIPVDGGITCALPH